jgi:two-component system, chemotaxis family, response regulator Rcp1
MTNYEPATPAEILIVEDNPGDVDLLLEFLQQTKVRNHVTVARDGEDAMAVLRQRGERCDSPRPDLILLDLNLPKKDGREVLKEIKADDVLRCIPVVILSSSQAEQDIAKSYALQANCYIVKPVDLEQFVTVIKSIENFWLSVVRLPTRGGGCSG